LALCVTIGIVHSDDSFRIGVCKLNSTTESWLWILFYYFNFILQRAKYFTTRQVFKKLDN
ncbi:MAG: hypothetical protein IJV39_04715, partial [Ruminococcus sp.]|nr:hypothetical protein [Ruminococcus sp.]